MSTLKVDTLQPNAQAAVTVDAAATVTGASTLQGNVTAQGNLDVSGNLGTSSTLTATKLALNGATPGAAGTVQGVTDLGCNNVTAAQQVTCASLTASSSASVASLVVGGETFEQRVTAHVSIAFSADVVNQVSTGASRFNFSTASSLTTVTLNNNRGFASANWQSASNGDKLVVATSSARTRPRNFVMVQFFDEDFNIGSYMPRFKWATNTTIEIYGWKVFSFSGSVLDEPADPVRYINIAMIG